MSNSTRHDAETLAERDLADAKRLYERYAAANNVAADTWEKLGNIFAGHWIACVRMAREEREHTTTSPPTKLVGLRVQWSSNKFAFEIVDEITLTIRGVNLQDPAAALGEMVRLGGPIHLADIAAALTRSG